jgi:hypothetical protein
MKINQTLELVERIEARRNARRGFLKASVGAAVAAGGLSLLAACDADEGPGTPFPTPTPTPTTAAVTDGDVLNFALQLEYLEAQFYSYAAFGSGLNANLLTGTGTQGTVDDIGVTGGPRQVSFAGETVIGEYAREIAYDEIAHVNFIRTALAGAGAQPVAMPRINISGNATGSFTAAARAAQVVPSTGTFDPYSSVNNFLLGAFIFEDVGVTAYMGGVALLTNKTFIEAAAGIHAAEAYHAGLVRTVLYRRGLDTQALIDGANAISLARDTLDGATTRDQGLTLSGNANIVPADSNAIAFVRTPQQVLNVVYLNSAAVTSGGFFPVGLNGNVRTSSSGS